MSWGKYRKVQNILCSNRKKITKIDEDGNESVPTMSYNIKFIYNVRFMASSLSNLVDNHAEGIHKIKYKIMIVF